MTSEISTSPPEEKRLSKTDLSDSFSSQRVFKKSSSNNKLTIYLTSRDLMVAEGKIDKLHGVLLVDPNFLEDRKVYGQITLTFRYGREDEEVMGLKFCNEAIMCLVQLYPPHSSSKPLNGTTAIQDALIKRLGSNAYPFTLEITPLAPPSVQLVPAKEYNGAPIGTCYDIRAYIDKTDEKLLRKSTVRMGIRVVQKAFPPPSPHDYNYQNKNTIINRQHNHNKQRRKHLFGCKSDPLDIKFPKDCQNKTQSLEMGLDNQEKQTHDPNKKGDTISFADSIIKSKNTILLDNEQNAEQEKHSSLHLETQKTLTEIVQGNNSIETDNEANTQNQFKSICDGKRGNLTEDMANLPAPTASLEKPFLLSEGKVILTASLDKAIYVHNEEIHVNVNIINNSNKTIRRIKVFVVQFVDVCMFSNGKFKNVVAMINTKENCPITSNNSFNKTFTLLPLKSTTKNWIALEDSYTKSGASLASTVSINPHIPEDRNVFAIYVSYYVKVKLLLSVMGGEVSLKLPFTLMYTSPEYELTESLSKVTRPDVDINLKSPVRDIVKSFKHGT